MPTSGAFASAISSNLLLISSSVTSGILTSGMQLSTLSNGISGVRLNSISTSIPLSFLSNFVILGSPMSASALTLSSFKISYKLLNSSTSKHFIKLVINN